MESVRDLISFFLKISVAIFVIVLVIVLTKSVPRKNESATPVASSTPKVDILPSPRKYSGIFGMSTSTKRTTPTPTFTTFSYSGPIAFSSSSGNPIHLNQQGGFNTYTLSQPQATAPAFQNQSPTSTLPVRNLSIYQGGHVYTGLSFVGEARSQMFRDGKFPIIVIDASGRMVGVTAAVAQTAWTVPGWVRFETRITYPLPANVPCTMIFEEALTQVERNRAPVRAALPINCN